MARRKLRGSNAGFTAAHASALRPAFAIFPGHGEDGQPAKGVPSQIDTAGGTSHLGVETATGLRDTSGEVGRIHHGAPPAITHAVGSPRAARPSHSLNDETPEAVAREVLPESRTSDVAIETATGLGIALLQAVADDRMGVATVTAAEPEGLAPGIPMGIGKDHQAAKALAREIDTDRRGHRLECEGR